MLVYILVKIIGGSNKDFASSWLTVVQISSLTVGDAWLEIRKKYISYLLKCGNSNLFSLRKFKYKHFS